MDSNNNDNTMQDALEVPGYIAEDVQVRTLREDDELWFEAVRIGKDILQLSDYTRNMKNIPELDKRKIKVEVPSNLGVGTFEKKLWFVNEPGLYRLIFNSRVPEAEAFQNWVFREVLPSIRKYGAYVQLEGIAPQTVFNLEVEETTVPHVYLVEEGTPTIYAKVDDMRRALGYVKQDYRSVEDDMMFGLELSDHIDPRPWIDLPGMLNWASRTSNKRAAILFAHIESLIDMCLLQAGIGLDVNANKPTDENTAGENGKASWSFSAEEKAVFLEDVKKTAKAAVTNALEEGFLNAAASIKSQ